MDNKWKYCTLKQAKRLVELGVVLKTEKYWVKGGKGIFILETKVPLGELDYMNKVEFTQIRIDHMLACYHDDIYPSPDVAELGKVLKGYHLKSHYYDDKEFDIRDVWWLTNWPEEELLKEFFNVGHEAQARATAVIWFIENKRATWDQEKQTLIAT